MGKPLPMPSSIHRAAAEIAEHIIEKAGDQADDPITGDYSAAVEIQLKALADMIGITRIDLEEAMYTFEWERSRDG